MTDKSPANQGLSPTTRSAPSAGRDTLGNAQQFPSIELERDTEPNLDVSGPRGRSDSEPRVTASTQPDREGPSVPLEPNIKEHGVWGTTSGAVGGFGETYEEQVARGSEPDLPSGAAAGAPDDSRLERELRKTLGRAHVDAADLRVAVHGDHVTLYGTVRDPLEKSQIEARARGVPGVGEVTSHIQVQESPTAE